MLKFDSYRLLFANEIRITITIMIWLQLLIVREDKYVLNVWRRFCNMRECPYVRQCVLRAGPSYTLFKFIIVQQGDESPLW